MNSKSVYELAAEQAESDIPAKQAEIAELEQRLQVAMRELNHLRNIAAFGKRPPLPHAAGGINPDRAVAAPARALHPHVATLGVLQASAHISGEGSYDPYEPPPTPPKSAYVRLHELFLANEKPLTAKEIQEQFVLHHGEALPHSTLYAALNKGLRKRQFVQENGAWRRRKKGEGDNA